MKVKAADLEEVMELNRTHVGAVDLLKAGTVVISVTDKGLVASLSNLPVKTAIYLLQGALKEFSKEDFIRNQNQN